RPERREFVGECLRRIPGYGERLQVKPALTGLAQVNGEYHTTPEYKLKYDLAYIYNYSLWLDMRILAETVKVMLTRRGVCGKLRIRGRRLRTGRSIQIAAVIAGSDTRIRPQLLDRIQPHGD